MTEVELLFAIIIIITTTTTTTTGKQSYFKVKTLLLFQAIISIGGMLWLYYVWNINQR